VARGDQIEALRGFYATLRGLDDTVEWLEAQAVAARATMLRPGYAVAGVWEPECYDIDVGTLHQAFLRGFRRQGGTLVTDAGVSAARRAAGLWAVTAGGERYEAPVLINAAGAWGDELARLAGALPVGLTPMRRTIITFDGPKGVELSGWPLVLDIGHQFYFKPESGRVLASPSDETPMPASDVQPEVEDIARLVDRLQRATTLAVPRPNSQWAGLRTIAPDRAPVVGFDDRAEGFFWLVGQGGFGIQTSPALSELAAALALGEAVPDHLSRHGITPQTYGVARLR
jgi:D-arginine dehydrogenase